jgi:phosphoglycerate dehydrogenase-like enzyme
LRPQFVDLGASRKAEWSLAVQTRAPRSGNVHADAMTNENALNSETRSKRHVVVTFSASAGMRQAFAEALDAVADITYLDDVGRDDRRRALASAGAVLAWNVDRELQGPDELRLLESAGFVQLVLAGVDGVPFDRIPGGVAVASNAGAFAEPMAEHVLALTLALAKRLPQNHAEMRRGEFDQQTPNRSLRGSVVGILGFGGIGQASARLFRAFGARIYAVNHSGQTDEPVDWIGTLRDLDAVLGAADVLVVSLPLTRETRGLIGERELSLMKPEAIFVNVARAAIVDEDALYEHLRSNPSFSAGIDTWWQEPRRQGSFATRRPFLDLPNVIGSPHNSAITAGSLAAAARHAADNVARYLRGEVPQHLVDSADYVA